MAKISFDSTYNVYVVSPIGETTYTLVEAVAALVACGYRFSDIELVGAVRRAHEFKYVEKRFGGR